LSDSCAAARHAIVDGDALRGGLSVGCALLLRSKMLLGILTATVAAAQPHQPLLWVAQQQQLQQAAVQQAAAAAAPKVAPTIPGQWHAAALVMQSGTTAATGAAPMSVFEDSTEKRRLQVSTGTFPFSPAGYPDYRNMSTYIFEGGTTIEINGACLLVASGPTIKFSSLFSWLPSAQDGGVVTHKGTPAHRWAFSYPPAHFYAEALFGPDHLPVAMTENYTDPHTPSSVHYEFSSFVPALPPDWDVSWGAMEGACQTPPRCPKPLSPQPINITMYIFHPPNQFDIAGQDLADAIGDNVFVCQDILGGQPNQTDHNYQWLTEWQLEVLPWWGQYQNCNGYGDAHSCISQETFLVGRESPEYLPIPGRTALQRQCGATDPKIGQWFSLATGGQCAPGVRPSYRDPAQGGCSWRTVQRVKTIDGEHCLVKGHDYRSLCAADGRAPFPSATRAFLAAFATSDLSKGGCPELVPPMQL
jgi:hypothetical protein